MVLVVDFKQLIKTKEYDFLRTNEHLGGNIILLTLGGSHAYGTNNIHSDIDVRGVAIEKPSDIIGFSTFKQVVETETDTTIYAFNRYVELLLENNPNTIEQLGCRPDHYLYLTDIGQQLLDNRKMFLSQKCIYAFGNYASSQLARLENALARDRLPQTKKEEHILNSIRNAMTYFDSRYTKFGENAIKLYIDKSDKADMDSEIFLDITLKDYPLRDFAGIMGEMQNVVRQYGKLNHRNKKKDENHLDKHAQHLVRLYLMALDLLEKEEIITYRENDLPLLKKIRTGGFRKEDGTYEESFFDMVEDYKKRFKYAAANTSLPKVADVKRVEEFVMEVNSKIIKGVI